MIVLGRIVAPFGVRGWLKIQPFGDDPLSWQQMASWWIGKNPDSERSEDWLPFKPKSIRPHGNGFVAALEEVQDRTAAEAIDGCYIAAPRESLPEPQKDEYYWADLIGLRVVGIGGAALGVVSGLLETGVHDVLEIKDGDIERLIPFVGAYVKDVSVTKGEILVEWESDW